MTTGAQVFDRLARASAASPSAASEPLARLAEQMVAASARSGQMLRELRDRMFPTGDDPGARDVAIALRAEFTQWATEAQAVFERARRLEQAGRAIAGTRELGDLIGLTLAMLQVTPEAHVRALDQLSRGETTPIAEVRRELQLKSNR